MRHLDRRRQSRRSGETPAFAFTLAFAFTPSTSKLASSRVERGKAAAPANPSIFLSSPKTNKIR
jgi:hypothetical protein